MDRDEDMNQSEQDWVRTWLIGGLIAISLIILISLIIANTAHAATTPIVIGHRGANTPTTPENTLKAMQYATPHAQMLEADIQWTKDSDDADTVGTIIVFHDATLDRTTNCTGNVSSRLWVYIRDNCRTTIAKQPVLRLVDLVGYATLVNKPIHFDLKTNMTSAQARQFWKHAKTAPTGSMLIGTKSRVDGMQKVKRLDAADTSHRLRYGYVTTGEPSATYVKTVGPYLLLEKDSSKTRVSYYKSNGIKVFLWTGKNESDYASMLSKGPDGVIVDDAKRYANWLVAR